MKGRDAVHATFPRQTGLGPALTIQTETRRAPETSWWAFAPREHFFAICYANYLDHMRGSEAERRIASIQWESSLTRDDARWRSKGAAA